MAVNLSLWLSMLGKWWWRNIFIELNIPQQNQWLAYLAVFGYCELHVLELFRPDRQRDWYSGFSEVKFQNKAAAKRKVFTELKETNHKNTHATTVAQGKRRWHFSCCVLLNYFPWISFRRVVRHIPISIILNSEKLVAWRPSFRGQLDVTNTTVVTCQLNACLL